MENSMVKEITPGDVEASDSPGTPSVTEQSLEEAGKWAEGPGALYEHQIPHATQRHHQYKSWNLGQKTGETTSDLTVVQYITKAADDLTVRKNLTLQHKWQSVML